MFAFALFFWSDQSQNTAITTPIMFTRIQSPKPRFRLSTARFRDSLVLTALILSVAISPAAPSLRSVLSPEEFTRAGLDKLTEEELAFLSDRLLGTEPDVETEPQQLASAPQESTATIVPPLEEPPFSRDHSRKPLPKQSADARGGPTSANRERPDKDPRFEGDAAFGNEAKIRREEERTRRIPNSIRSRIPGTFKGWNGRTVFRLENGQVWQQIEDGQFSVSLESPDVTIERGALGAFYLHVSSYGSRIKVRRIK